MPVRLSLPSSAMKPHYTVVVVGSGYGGAISASRLSRAGQSVCVLERGREIQSGEYPDTELEVAAQTQVDSPVGRLGSRTGLFDFRVNDDMCVLLGCGLGGTSLINANVSIRPEPRVFMDRVWPEPLRQDFTALEEGFTRAIAMLKPNPHPRARLPLAKTDAVEKGAKALGVPFRLLDINVHYGDAGPNHVGVEQKPCTLCGDCVSGCNHQAKNTVLMNYLPDAVNHGAEIYTRCSVHHLERRDGRWVVHYEMLEAGREAFDGPQAFVTADIVVLGAGALGSTEILLRSRERGLPLSERLGEHFSGNGDVLSFSYNVDQPINGIGYGHRVVSPNGEPVGPCITSGIDARERPELDDGMIIEEGSIPGALASVLPLSFATVAAASGKDTDFGVTDALREVGRETESLIAGPYVGAIKNTQVFLTMTHDDDRGRMRLEDDRLRIDWKGLADQPIFKKVGANLLEVTKALGGTYLENPLTQKFLGRELITVHPLGGCCMGDDAERGVTNHKGQVFAGAAGDAVHEGLYVADGSIIPRPLGVNPLLTISALSERNARLMVEERGWKFDGGATSTPKAQPPLETRPGIRFTETMHGHVSTTVGSSYAAGEAQAKEARAPFRFVLTIAAEDVEALLEDPSTPSHMTGTVEAPGLSASPLIVSEGRFQLFVKQPETPNLRHMRYEMLLVAEEGPRIHFSGVKQIHDDAGPDLWSDTTTLYVTLREGSASGRELGKGILRLTATDFLTQLFTLEVPGAKDLGQRLALTARFGEVFAGELWEVYGGVLAHEPELSPKPIPRKRRPLRAPAPEWYPVQTEDGVALRLTRFQGGEKGPVMLIPGLGVSSFIFTLDTIETNLVEYLCAHGYDVWCLDHRSSIALPTAQVPYSGEDLARYDYPASVDAILKETHRPSLQIVAHCYGATTLTLALLGGLKGVRSVVYSQVAAHARVPFSTALKSGLHVPDVLDALGVDSLSAYAGQHPGFWEKLFGATVKLTAPSAEEDVCTSEVCARIAFLYGVLYEHRNLNAATHAVMHELFGVANIHAFEHLARISRAHHVVGFDGEEKYLGHPERMKLPIAFIGGALNRCWLPQGLLDTYEWLSEANGPGLYSRHLVPGYGHIDCIFGEYAYRDVYPYVLDHLEATLTETGPREAAPLPKAPLPKPPPREDGPPPRPSPLPPRTVPGAPPVVAPRAFVNLFRLAGTVNLLMAGTFVFTQGWAAKMLNVPTPNLPLVGWMFGAFVGLLGILFWEISRDLPNRYEMIRYGWVAKLTAAVCTTAAFLMGQVPMEAMIATALGDLVWIPLFIGVQRQMHRRVQGARAREALARAP